MNVCYWESSGRDDDGVITYNLGQCLVSRKGEEREEFDIISGYFPTPFLLSRPPNIKLAVQIIRFTVTVHRMRDSKWTMRW